LRRALSFRVQSLATWLLVAGIVVPARGVIHAAGVAVSPIDSDIAAVACPFRQCRGTGSVLFMGFELLCTQIEASDVQKISWALKSTVLLLASPLRLRVAGPQRRNLHEQLGHGNRALVRAKSTWQETLAMPLCSPSRSPFVCSHRSLR
jgi:hypothetical protein